VPFFSFEIWFQKNLAAFKKFLLAKKRVFDPWDFQNSQKEVSGNFESMTTFALLIEIYLPCQFHNFPLSHSLETPERRAVPLIKNFKKLINNFNYRFSWNFHGKTAVFV
jgi:hypothetical protein